MKALSISNQVSDVSVAWFNCFCQKTRDYVSKREKEGYEKRVKEKNGDLMEKQFKAEEIEKVRSHDTFSWSFLRGKNST